MCGIFAVVSDPKKSKLSATSIVLEGLKKLEYRGYDSWGIAVSAKNKLFVDKHVGKITSAKPKLPQSSTGLGHTRWATHGKVSDRNAHPFVGCRKQIGLVHNGIIDNYQDLHKKLKNKHSFKSETDSEVLLHLIEEYVQKYSFREAVRKAFKQAQGLNAILCIKNGVVIAAKTGSPLVVGHSKGQNFIASDLWSILDHTPRVSFLKDGELVEITSSRVNFFNIKSGHKIKPKIKKINWKQQSASKQNFPHFMLKEIHEQPEIIERLLVDKQQETKDLATMIKKANETFFVACGTAAYAAYAGQYFFSELAKVHTDAAVGSEFIYNVDFLKKGSLVIALSQSGETIDTVQSVQQGKQYGAKVACLTNVLGSTLYRESDKKILLDCGPEIGVASTKAFIAKITLLLMTAGYMNGDVKNVQKQIKQASLASVHILKPDYQNKIKKLARKIIRSQSMFVVGRGVSYTSALETALKIKEISYIHAEGLAGGELKHGPIALIKKGTPIVVFAPEDETYNDMISGAMEMKARGGLIIGVTTKPHEVFDIILPITDCGNATIIPSIVVGQTLAYNLATLRGIDPDKPRNLAKSVTVK